MNTATSKIWIRLMAVLQLMTSLSFIQASLYSYQIFVKDQTGVNGVLLAIAIALSILNLVAGWTLLDESRFALQLSFLNILAQTISINTPIFLYIYTGVVRLSISFTVHTEPKPDLLFGAGFDLLRSYFYIAFSQADNLPTFAVSPIALAFVVYLSRRLLSARASLLASNV